MSARLASGETSVAGTRHSSGWNVAARIFTGIAVLVAVLMPIVGRTENTVILASLPVSVIIAGRRYGWRMAGLYFLVTFTVGNVFENLSINTGFPFGTYHYPGSSPRILDFPILVAVAYCSLGLICWLVASTLLDSADLRLGDRRDRARRINIVAIPVLAAALMTMFDVGIDSAASTIQQNWVWESGGGVFGVPWTNYLGWWFVTYIFFQIFAVFLSRRRSPGPSSADFQRREASVLAVIVYFLLVSVTMVQFFTQGSSVVTDAAGHVWNTDDIYATLFTFNLFGPIVIIILAALKIARDDATANPAHTSSNAQDLQTTH